MDPINNDSITNLAPSQPIEMNTTMAHSNLLRMSPMVTNHMSSQLNEAAQNGDWIQAILNIVNKHISRTKVQLKKVNNQ